MIDFYYSYWSQTDLKGKDDSSESWMNRNKSVGALVDFFILLKISLYFLRKNHPNSRYFLVTDSLGKQRAKKHNLKFTKIFTTLDDLPSAYWETWSLAKLKAYHLAASCGDRPFLHLDADFFPISPFQEKIIKNKNVVVWSYDYEKSEKDDTPYNYSVYTSYIKNFYEIKTHDYNYTYNCGIFGGTDLNFINKYASSAIQMVLDEDNKKYFLTPNNKLPNRIYKDGVVKEFGCFSSHKACVSEQYYLAGYCHKEGISPLIYEPYKGRSVHLIGPNKMNYINYLPLEKNGDFHSWPPKATHKRVPNG